MSPKYEIALNFEFGKFIFLWAHVFRRSNVITNKVTLQIRYLSKSLKMNETKQRQHSTLDNLQAILS